MIPKDLLDLIKREKERIAFNTCLLEVLEGQLYKYIEADLRKQLSGQSFEQARQRIAPINVLQKIIEKLSAIYNDPPSRTIVDGSPEELELFNWYVEKSNVNNQMKISNEYYNLFKYSLVQVFTHLGAPRVRAIANDKFLVFSEDAVDPLRPTIYVLIYSKRDMYGESHCYYHVYDGSVFYEMDHEGKTSQPIEIVHPPFIYINKSNNCLMPKADDDIFRMTKLIPLLISDLNFAVMYQSFSIIYGINVDDENIEMSPNAFWRFKSDPSREGSPSLGTIKPSVDIAEVTQLIQNELSFWLSTKGIRASSVGQLTADTFSSGISKMIDEMDATQEKKKQVVVYRQAELDLWRMIRDYHHMDWVLARMLDTNSQFSGNDFFINFAEQIPMQSRAQVLDELVKELQAGFTTKKIAISKLNPQMSDEEVEALLKEIELDKIITIDVPSEDDNGSQTTKSDAEYSEGIREKTESANS